MPSPTKATVLVICFELVRGSDARGLHGVIARNHVACNAVALLQFLDRLLRVWLSFIGELESAHAGAINEDRRANLHLTPLNFAFDPFADKRPKAAR